MTTPSWPGKTVIVTPILLPWQEPLLAKSAEFLGGLGLPQIVFETRGPEHESEPFAISVDEFFRRLFEERSVDWAICLDVDAWFVRPERLAPLVWYMATHQFAVCGVPDSGMLPNMRRGDAASPNTFFAVLHTAAIRQVWPLPESRKELFAPSDRLEEPPGEPYHRIFRRLWRRGLKFLPLYAVHRHSAHGMTLATDHRRRPLVWHSWYSRHYRAEGLPVDHYNEDPGGTARIDAGGAAARRRVLARKGRMPGAPQQIRFPPGRRQELG